MSEPKYQRLFEELKSDILSGKYRHGQKMPSEAALVRRTGLSRITVARSLHELQLAGLAERIAGSGTYARSKLEVEDRSYLFGLLLPELGKTEIFAPICRCIASAPAGKKHALLWGNPGDGSLARQATTLLEQFCLKPVDGVFFAPLESGTDAERVNHRILRRLRKQSIPTILLDRRVSRLSNRDRADIIGLNHQHAAYMATEHLLQSPCRGLCFLAGSYRTSSVAERQQGFWQAIADHGMKPSDAVRFDLDSSAVSFKRWCRRAKPLGIVCVNDQLAGQAMHLVLSWGLRIPDDCRMTGIDDLGYASMLPVPLTSVRQPIEQIGETALQLMLGRIQSPNHPIARSCLTEHLTAADRHKCSRNRLYRADVVAILTASIREIGNDCDRICYSEIASRPKRDWAKYFLHRSPSCYPPSPTPQLMSFHGYTFVDEHHRDYPDHRRRTCSP